MKKVNDTRMRKWQELRDEIDRMNKNMRPIDALNFWFSKTKRGKHCKAI